jgi:hypothetical protein
MKRLSADMRVSLHWRFEVACGTAEKLMVEEVLAFTSLGPGNWRQWRDGTLRHLPRNHRQSPPERILNSSDNVVALRGGKLG